MPQKKSEGLFSALTMRQTDGLAVRIGRGADRLAQSGARDAALDAYDAAKDLHDSWTARNSQGESAKCDHLVRRQK